MLRRIGSVHCTLGNFVRWPMPNFASKLAKAGAEPAAALADEPSDSLESDAPAYASTMSMAERCVEILRDSLRRHTIFAEMLLRSNFDTTAVLTGIRNFDQFSSRRIVVFPVQVRCTSEIVFWMESFCEVYRTVLQTPNFQFSVPVHFVAGRNSKVALLIPRNESTTVYVAVSGSIVEKNFGTFNCQVHVGSPDGPIYQWSSQAREFRE